MSGAVGNVKCLLSISLMRTLPIVPYILADLAIASEAFLVYHLKFSVTAAPVSLPDNYLLSGSFYVVQLHQHHTRPTSLRGIEISHLIIATITVADIQ